VDLKTVHKDLLRPGTYTLPNRVKWTCTPADVRNACVIGNRMLHHADALSPPLIWEHDWNAEAIPLRVLLSAMAGDERREFAAGFAKNVFGHASRYYLRDERGQPALWAEARIKADAAPRFEVARYVSPRVDHDYRAGDGTYWPGATVHHIAATPRPVQLSQLPVMLSGLIGPGRSRRSAILSRVFLGATMADEKDDEGGEGGADAGLKKLLTALANFGINLPEGINSIEDLGLAIDTLAANNAGPAATESDPLDDLDNPPAGADAAGGAMLSDLAANGRKGLAVELKRLERYLVSNHVLTVPQVRQFEADFAKVPQVAMLSSLAGKPTDSDTLKRWEAAKAKLRTAVKGGGGQPANLSGLDAHPAPDTPHRGVPTADEIAAEVARVKKDHGKGDPAKLTK
jgi:hypothetical protein